MSRFETTSSILLALAILAITPAPGTAQQRFSDVTDVVVVEVPVQVLRDGEPVRGLTRDDFEILEGRKRQEIVGFEVIDLTAEGAAEAAQPVEVSASGRRHFLLLFDLSFSDPAAIVRAQEAASRLVLEAMHPTDLVGVATYSASQGIRIPLNFTSDRRQVDLAIRTLGLPQLVETVRDPLGLVLGDQEVFGDFESPGSGEGGGGIGGGFDAEGEVRGILESIERNVSAATNRNEILALSSAMGGLAEALAAAEGRKHVLYLSEGFDSATIIGKGRGSSIEEQQRIQQINEAAMSGEVWNVNSDERFGETQTQNQLTDMLRQFVRAGATIEAIDIGGLRDAPDTRTEDGLFMLAEETGGDFVNNFNDLSGALGRVMKRTSVTYVLAFQPSKLRYDGRFREIKVRLKDDPRGTRIVHRPGYVDPKPLADLSGLERRFSTADLILGGAKGGAVKTSVLAGAFPFTSQAAYVPVLVEIDGSTLLAGTKGDVLPTEIYAYAIDASGEVRDFFTQAMNMDLAKVRPALEQSGFKFWGNLELPPGDYSVRVLVRNGESGVSGLDVVAVKVPRFGGGESTLMPPFVPEPPGKWLLGREQGTDPSRYDYPFLLRQDAFIPAARPVIQAGVESPVTLVGYNLGAGSLAARAELLAADGQPVEGVEIELEDRYAGADGLDRLVAGLRCAGVAAGEYTLVVTVRDVASGASQSSSIPVVVAG